TGPCYTQIAVCATQVTAHPYIFTEKPIPNDSRFQLNTHFPTRTSLDIPVRASSSSEGQGTDKNVHPTETPDDFLKIAKPEDIRLCDPAVGSGHMLTYAFDLLTLIYEEEGYAPTEIPALILRHNLHGLEICPRAAQLAELALVFKAREKSRRFFQPEHFVRPNIIELQNVSFADGELEDYLRTMGIPARRGTSEEGDGQECPSYGKLVQLMHQFEEAKNFGSLIQPCLDERAIANARRAIEAKDLGGQLFLRETHLKVLRVLEQAEALTQRYHVVVANPPYMGKGAFNATLRKFADTNYANSRADLFSMFIDGCRRLSLPKGFVGMITMHGWMFIATFEAFRRAILAEASIDSMLHLGARAFDSISGEIVKATAFVLLNRPKAGRGLFLRLTVERSELAKRDAFLNANTATLEKFFCRVASSFSAIPSSPLAYWVSPKTRELFQTLPSLGDLAEPRQGLATTDNGRFVRFWQEVPFSGIGFGFPDGVSAAKSGLRWFPFNKGGSFRKWFGNDDVVVNWQNDGHEIRENIVTKYPYLNGNPDFVAKNPGCYFREGTTWSKITSGDFSVRRTLCGYVFSDAGMKIFHDSLTTLDEITGLLNSRLTPLFLGSLSETLNFEQGNIARIPYKPVPLAVEDVRKCVEIARADWDNFETSWDFRDQPLLRPGLKGATLEASWRNWEAQSIAAIRRMQELETENNRLFIAAYGLDGELQPEVPEAQITLARAEARRDMAAFLSYAVGCMLGRYSLDAPGLILADAGATVEDYLKKVSSFRSLDILVRDSPRSLDIPVRASSTMKEEATDRNVHPTEDNVIPILDGDWFPDDITERFKKFLKVTFGEQHFDENMRFLEESLGKDVRKYFLTDFYKNHVQTYKKRPIYWLFSSPKGTFNALIYMHRYRPDTVSVVLKYLRDFQTKLQAHKQHLQSIADSADAKKADKTKALKEITQLTKDLKELEDYERKVIYPLASERREIDLDDGVKHNYPLFGEALKKIAGLDAKEDE
ncbi:MAG: BREX-1 system adenine-specific DNA-methyltransferase PglX, partial [Planctomycetales bacterium]|nr:BREX-1 system adenine-specific DNA-methyltransferase PglX [Planctomycetales bacterium]